MSANLHSAIDDAPEGLEAYRGRVRILEPVPCVLEDTFAAEVARGLSRSQKTLPPRHLYDEQGSNLFEQICQVPEYYLTRTEHDILQTHADDIVTHFGDIDVLSELGAGSALKTQRVLDALVDRHKGAAEAFTYNPIDISREMIQMCAERVLSTYDDLQVFATLAEYNTALRETYRVLPGRKAIVFLGSSFGNLLETERTAFLKLLRDTLTHPEDAVLMGIDMVKDAKTLEAAYDDSAGVTRAFEMNILARINRELDGRFDLDAFDYEARFVPEKGRVEMHLISKRQQTVPIATLDMAVKFDAGESIHVESSRKFTEQGFAALCGEAGLRVETHWADERDWFRLCLIRK